MSSRAKGTLTHHSSSGATTRRDRPRRGHAGRRLAPVQRHTCGAAPWDCPKRLVCGCCARARALYIYRAVLLTRCVAFSAASQRVHRLTGAPLAPKQDSPSCVQQQHEATFIRYAARLQHGAPEGRLPMRKAAIAEANTRPDARQQCWGSLTRWLLLDNERRNGRWESLAHDMRGLKVR